MSEKTDTLTPAEWAARTGNTVKMGPATRLLSGHEDGQSFSPRHSAAAMLHGWHAHAMHTAEPLALSLADYEAALAAVDSVSPKLTPHAPACSPYRLGGKEV